MPAFASVVLNDRTTPSPVAHTFLPSGKEVGTNVALFYENNGGILVGRNRLSISTRTTPTRRISEQRFSVPVVEVETINGIDTPTVVMTNRASVTFDFDLKSSTQQRDNLQGLVYNAQAVAQTLIRGVVVEGGDVY